MKQKFYQVYIIIYLLTLILFFTFSTKEQDNYNYEYESLLEIMKEEQEYSFSVYEDLFNENQKLIEENTTLKNSGSINVDTITEDEFIELCQCVQAEAGPKNYESQKMITKVILNRVESNKFPNNIHDVIYAKGQFQVVGSMHKQVVADKTKLNVLEVLLLDYDMPEDVLYFHSGKNEKSPKVYKCVEGTVFCY